MYRKLIYLLISALVLLICTSGVMWAAIDHIVLSRVSDGPVPIKSIIQFTAKAYDENNLQVTTAKFTWACDPAAGTISTAGKFTAGVTPGTYENAVTVTAVGTAVSMSANIISTRIPAKIIINPIEPVTLACAETKLYTAIVQDVDGLPIDEAQVKWSLTTSRIGAINPMTGELVASPYPGKYPSGVVATYGAKKAYATVTVVAPPPTKVRMFVSSKLVAPALNVTPAAKMTFKAVGYDSLDRAIYGLKFTYGYTGNAGTINTTSGAFAAVKTAGSTGAVTAQALINGQPAGALGTTDITIVPGAASKIIVTPNPVTLACAGTEQFSALVQDAYANIINGAQVKWSLSSTKIGAINPDTGVLVAGAYPGKYTSGVVATYGTKKGYATATVVAPPPTTVKIFTSSGEVTQTLDLAPVSSTTFTAKGYDSLNRAIYGLKFVFSNTGNAGLVNMTSGLFKAVQTAGNTGTITAQALINGAANGATGTAQVKVVPGAAAKVVVSPASVTLVSGDPQQYSAEVKDTYNNVITDAQVSWSLVSLKAGTITADGLFTAGTTAGIYKSVVKATSVIGKKIGYADITVLAAPPKTLITGKVISSNGSIGLANVHVYFGDPEVEAITGSDGKFTLDLGYNTVLSYFLPPNQYTFRIDYSDLGENYDPNGNILYKDGVSTAPYSPASINIRADVIAGLRTDLGTIILAYQMSGDDDELPPPPP